MTRDVHVDSRKYADLLAPIFSPNKVNTFEFACALLRVGGIEDAGWDALQESREVLDDLSTLTQLELPKDRFKDVEKTRWRLGILAYAHITEMDAPYHMLANLLRVRAKMKYDMSPFKRNDKTKKRRSRNVTFRPRPSPKAKIEFIKDYAGKAGHPQVGNVFDDFYFADLRNAVNHSDYVFHNDEFRMLQGHILEEERRVLSPVVPLKRLGSIINLAVAFYSVFFALEKRARAGFANLGGKCFPYDTNLKGLLEFLIDNDGLLCGFKVHWPNEHDSVYQRTANGCTGTNICPNPDGSINFFVGEYLRDHDPFSELIARGSQPRYTPPEGSTEPPQWPSTPK